MSREGEGFCKDDEVMKMTGDTRLQKMTDSGHVQRELDGNIPDIEVERRLRRHLPQLAKMFPADDAMVYIGPSKLGIGTDLIVKPYFLSSIFPVGKKMAICVTSSDHEGSKKLLEWISHVLFCDCNEKPTVGRAA